MKLQLHTINLLLIGIALLTSGRLFSQRSTASSNVSTFTINAPELDSEKRIWIYLPYNYSSSNDRFPVIYMHDAQNLFDAAMSYAGEWNIDETLDSIKAKVIVVGIEHGNSKRIDELTPFQNEKYGGGDGDTYLKFLVETLKPYIDKQYRTKSGKKHTTVFGSSLGGLISYYAILKYPEVFGGGGVFSPSLWFTDDIFEITEQSKKINAKIYLMSGDNESENMVSEHERLVMLLNEKVDRPKDQLKSAIVKGGQHNEKLWRAQFLNAYLWLK